MTRSPAATTDLAYSIPSAPPRSDILSRKWSVSAETGAENAADLLYTIEVGKTPGGGT